MKICFPVESDNGLDSVVFGHFGSAPLFVVFDSQTKSLDTINNHDLGHIHGKCSPIKALNGNIVDSIIVGGIGAGAINKLRQMGIKVYKAAEGTIQDNLSLFESDKLPEIMMGQACGGHIGGGCAH